MKKQYNTLLMIGSMTSLLLLAVQVEGKVRVVASIPDLASIAAYIGTERIDAATIARGSDDPHTVELLPSHMLKVARSDIYLKVGLGLDQWADGIIDGSRNGRLVVVDCSQGIETLEKSAGRVSAEMGDVHPFGNPHYWLDPSRGAQVAATIASALAKVDPPGGEHYFIRLAAFQEETDRRKVEWQRQLLSTPSLQLLTYHQSWVYLAAAFNLEIVGVVEPYPGIPPTASHLEKLIDLVTTNKVGLLLQEPFYPADAGRFLARRAGMRILIASPSCGGISPDDYFDHIDQIVGGIAGDVR